MSSSDNSIYIDAKGMMCPQPVIALAKAKRQCSNGGTIIIEADDLAFENDVRAWCHATGSLLMNIEHSDNLIRAHIQIATSK